MQPSHAVKYYYYYYDGHPSLLYSNYSSRCPLPYGEPASR